MNQRIEKKVGSYFYYITLQSRNFDSTSPVVMLKEPPFA